jgi:hypothetical protein
MIAGHSHPITFLVKWGHSAGGGRGRLCPAFVLKVEEVELMDNSIHLPEKFPAPDLSCVC